MLGPVLGTVPGTVLGPVPCTVLGPVPGTVLGPVPGTVLGTVPCTVLGTVPGTYVLDGLFDDEFLKVAELLGFLGMAIAFDKRTWAQRWVQCWVWYRVQGRV